MTDPAFSARRWSAAGRLARASLLASLLWATSAWTTSAAAAELATSADYIVGFVRFVHWNDESRANAWSICVAGSIPDAQLDRYAGAKVRGKPFSVRRVAADDGLAGCQVLDLTGADMATRGAFLQRSRDRAVLSVGTGADFCASGGLICLRPPGSRQKFDINLTQVKASGLRISARLLMLGSERAPADVMP